MGKFTDRLAHAWNAFMNKDPTYTPIRPYGETMRPDRMKFSRGSERTILNSIYTRIALDTAAITIEHVRLDDDGRFSEIINSSLNRCLNESANVDQTGRALRQDIVASMLDEGYVAVVPVDTTTDPTISGAFEINTLRVGKIVEFYPKMVKILLYDENSGRKSEVVLPKSMVAIVENPFYSVMNEPNSTLQRIKRKLTLLDYVDEQSGSGKLDMIIQLPYTVKTDIKREHANRRIKDIQDQLANSKYGIAYTDGTEKVTQLNRSLENKLLSQIEYLMNMLFSQLGLTQEIMNGSADANTMNNYYSRTIEPIISTIVDEMKRKFLTRTATTQGQSICFFRDPFKLVPISDLAELVDKFTRNEVMTSNEWRQIIGLKPSKDPSADELRNKNLSQSTADVENKQTPQPTELDEAEENK